MNTTNETHDPLAHTAALLLGPWGPKYLAQWRTAYPDRAIENAFEELKRQRRRGVEIHAPAHYVAAILRERSRRLAWLKRQVNRTARSAAA
jgi:hypothetical protein